MSKENKKTEEEIIEEITDEEIKANIKDNKDREYFEKRKIGKNKKITDAFRHAASGILTATQSERNIKIQFTLIIIALVLGVIFKLTKIDILLVVLAMFFIVFAEMINTAIEAVVDLHTDEYHPKAKKAKDVAAGAVVIATLNAIVVAYFVFFEKIATFGLKYLVTWSTANPTMYFTMLILATLILIIVFKLLSKKLSDNKFIPSGQAMVATSIFMAIWSQTKNVIVITAGLIFVMLVCLNRISNDRRSIWEVTVGAGLRNINCYSSLYNTKNIWRWIMSRTDDYKKGKKRNERIKSEVKRVKKERDKSKFEFEDKNKFKKSKKNKKIENLSGEDLIKYKKERKQKRICIILIILLLIIFITTFSLYIYIKFTKKDNSIKKGIKIENKGLRLDVIDLNSDTRPFAVMIDNNEDAWPQFNVNEALVVYEMHVEGGLSRLMAIFKDKPDLEKVGPLRSARHYFLDYVKEYDAIYVHEGYSPRAASEINTRNIDSVVYTSGLFYRDETRWAPHNAITSGKRMIDAAKDKGFSLKTKTKPPLKYSRVPLKLEKSIPATTINTGFSNYATLKLVYNKETKKYEKYEMGELLKDAVTDKPLAATNIIILQVDSYPLTGYGSGKSRVHIDTTDKMSGYYFTHRRRYKN